MRVFSLFLVLIAGGTAVAAETAPGAESSLEELLAFAESHNPGLEELRLRAKSARATVRAVTGLPDPRLSYGRFLQSVETRVGPQRQRVGVSQTFPLFGKLGLQGSMAAAGADAQLARYQQRRLAVRFRIRTLWNDLYALDRSIEIAQRNLDLASYLEGVVRRLYAAGTGSYADVLKSQVELARAEDRLQSLVDQRDPLVAEINVELGRAPHGALPTPTLVLPPGPLASLEVLERRLSQDNPELQALELEALRQEHGIDLASRRGLPDLTLGADFIDVGAARSPDVPDGGKDAWLVHASLNLPLWRGKVRAQKDAAQAGHAAALHRRSQRHLELRARLLRATVELRDARRKIVLYDETLLPRARQSLEVTLGAFTAGSASFLDLVDAQQTVLELQLAVESARADAATHYAELEMLLGGPMEPDSTRTGELP